MSKDLCDCILGVLLATLTLIALRQSRTSSPDARSTAKNPCGCSRTSEFNEALVVNSDVGFRKR
jgi:hypothetical protein